MLLREDTHAIQQKLANYCRDGKLVEIEGALTDRLPNYRRLVYNVIYGIMEKAYPITFSILSIGEFKSLINAFFTQHDAQEPQVWKLPGEFFEFVSTLKTDLKESHPYLIDLMNMEWKEILVYNRENRIHPEFRKTNNLDSESLVTNPDFEILHLNYPVYKGDFENISDQKGDYRLLLFRNVDTFKVHFMEVSPIHEVLIDGLSQSASFNAVTDLIFESIEVSDKEAALAKLRSFCERLVTEGFILGSLANGTS